MTAVEIVALAETVTEPGVYDMPDGRYHGDPVPGGSLSVSGAKKLLPPSCPAIYKWERDHGQTPKRVFDFGTAAHKLALGVGVDVVVIEAENYRTKAAQQAQEEARAAGLCPVLRTEWQTVEAMAQALAADPIAGPLLNVNFGVPEASLFWQDSATDVWRRCRVDWLPIGKRVVADYKTTTCAAPEAFAKSAANYGYHMQAAWYLDAVTALELIEDPAFVFIAQEKTPPYLVTVVELDALALRVGRERNARALDIYAQCAAVDVWPSYTNDVALVSLPRWAEYEYEQESA